jgi:hypothetical protein
MKRIKFTQLVISPQYGNLQPGSILACSDAFADHCVNEIRCAQYLEVKQEETAAAVEEPPPPVSSSETSEPAQARRKRKGAS